MIKRTSRHSILALIPLALASALLEWKRLPLSILVGGGIALANLKALHWGVTGMMNPEAVRAARGRLLFFSIFRLLAVVLILGALLYLGLVNIIGLLTGVTVVFFFVMKEGLRETRRL